MRGCGVEPREAPSSPGFSPTSSITETRKRRQKHHAGGTAPWKPSASVGALPGRAPPSTYLGAHASRASVTRAQAPDRWAAGEPRGLSRA